MPDMNVVGYHDPTETIDTYYDCDKVNLVWEGLPDYTLTKDGRIWSTKSYNDRKPGWVHPINPAYPAHYNLRDPSCNVVTVNVDVLVAKYFIVPTMLSMPEHFKRLGNTPIIVSDTGVIFDESMGRFRNPSKGGKYKHFPSQGKYYNVHRVVAELFVPNADPTVNTCVNHLDFNRWNNKASNLEWCTQRENTEYSRRAGRFTGSTRRDEDDSGMYVRHGGKKSKHCGVTAMMRHVEGPNWPKK